jgi:hypothetical protein
VVLTSLTDAFPGAAPVNICGNLIGTVLQPGGSVTCDFTAAAPMPAGASLTDTVVAVVVEQSNPANALTVQDTSLVRTVSVLGTSVEQPTLPFTGGSSARLLWLAAVLAGLGLVIGGLSLVRRNPDRRGR